VNYGEKTNIAKKIMNYNELFQGGSCKFIADLVSKIVYQGLGAAENEQNQFIVILVATLIVVFVLYKLVWCVWKGLKWLISLL